MSFVCSLINSDVENFLGGIGDDLPTLTWRPEDPELPTLGNLIRLDQTPFRLNLFPLNWVFRLTCNILFNVLSELDWTSPSILLFRVDWLHLWDRPGPTTVKQIWHTFLTVGSSGSFSKLSSELNTVLESIFSVSYLRVVLPNLQRVHWQRDPSLPLVTRAGSNSFLYWGTLGSCLFFWLSGYWQTIHHCLIV